jgi:hypothetical protein
MKFFYSKSEFFSPENKNGKEKKTSSLFLFYHHYRSNTIIDVGVVLARRKRSNKVCFNDNQNDNNNNNDSRSLLIVNGYNQRHTLLDTSCLLSCHLKIQWHIYRSCILNNEIYLIYPAQISRVIAHINSCTSGSKCTWDWFFSSDSIC